MRNNKEKKSVLIKLQIPAGKATPAPPLGPALGQHGVSIMDFCKAYNAQTADKEGQVIPVEILVAPDKSFTFKLKTPPTSQLILKALNLKSGSAIPNRVRIGTLSRKMLEEIAVVKMPDLNVNNDLEAAIKIIAGTANSMGIDAKC